MNKENILCLAAGFVLGAATGAIGHYIWNKRKTEVIEEEEETLDNRYVRHIDDLDDEATEVNPVDDREDGVLSPEKREEIKEKLMKNHKETSDYANMYKAEVDDQKVSEHSELFRTPEPEDESPKIEIQEYQDKPPEIISAEEFANLPAGIDTKAMYYYDHNAALVDEDDELIEDPDTYISDHFLDEFVDSGEEIMFIMNYRLNTAYEIHRIMGSYQE